MTLVDLYDWYLDGQGNLNRWRRGSQVIPGQPTAPGIPRSPRATVSGTTVTVTWALPLSDGGSPLTAIKVTQEGGSTHTLAASATSDTFTVSGSGPWTFDIVASNIVGDSAAAAAVATTAATAYRFPGDTLPLLTGQILLGCTENDDDGTKIKAGWEYTAPEADTGLKYSIIKTFYSGSGVLSAFTASTGAIAVDIKKHYSRGHILLLNVAIQQSGQTWRQSADGRNSTLWDNWIHWVEEGTDMPDVPVWLCMPHEAQQTSKTDPDPTKGMLPGDYADMQVAFRARMDAYATSKAGSPTAYKWKHLAFGGIHTGEAFSVGATSIKNIDGYYVSHATGLAVAKRTHDFVGGDPYQQPISGSTAIGRTGVPMWNTVSQAMAKWCKAKGYPIVWGEFGIHNTDGDAGAQLQDFWNHVTDGTWDVAAVIYFNAAPNGPIPNPPGDVGRFLFSNTANNDGATANGLFYDVWKSLMQKSNVAHFWDVGYSKPPGV